MLGVILTRSSRTVYCTLYSTDHLLYTTNHKPHTPFLAGGTVLPAFFVVVPTCDSCMNVEQCAVVRTILLSPLDFFFFFFFHCNRLL